MDTFIEDVASLVSRIGDEYEITKQVAARLSDLLAGDYRLPPEVTRPSNERHVTYPLYIAPDDSWSLASVRHAAHRRDRWRERASDGPCAVAA
jgi:3-mercaptopropionate dioxygenase